MSGRVNKPVTKPSSLVKSAAQSKRLANTRSPVLSPTSFTSPHSIGKSKKSNDSSIIDITDSPSGSSFCRSLFDPEKCPCNQSLDSWKIDCSKCGQFWHTNCVTLEGLGKNEINKLVKWLCPFCYIAPISTSDFSDISSCLTCRNTKTLRDANNAFASHSSEPDHIIEIEHNQVPYDDMSLNFITTDEAEKLTKYLDTCSFKHENGHSVVSFGESYAYTGSKSSSSVPPIPDELKPVFDRIQALQTELVSNKYQNENLTAPTINSCLVNKYEGANSYLPRHSDSEVTINPESSIFTVSLGQSCNLKFIERRSGSDSVLACPDRSLYHMTRRSQEIFDHLIEKGEIESGVRYSLTFRCVSWTNKNSTCLMGDSNTGLLRFGDDKRGTFGKLMPGRKFWSPRIEDLDPVSCMGYANVVLLCGINDVRQPDVVNEHDIAGCYNKLKLKIKQIKYLSPSTAVFVCRLLPTKLPQLNRKVDTFNRLIYFDLIPSCRDVVYVESFERFARNHVLADDLSKQYDRLGRPDTLHLNRSGARLLASFIKHAVFLRLNGGVDKRKRTGNLDGRLYSNVASALPPSQRRR